MEEISRFLQVVSTHQQLFHFIQLVRRLEARKRKPVVRTLFIFFFAQIIRFRDGILSLNLLTQIQTGLQDENLWAVKNVKKTRSTKNYRAQVNLGPETGCRPLLINDYI